MAHLPASLTGPRLTVVVGHSGSGKTEFAVNLALALAETGRQTVLADLDVVNPYYRSRERRELLREHGIGLIASSQACLDADLPAMPAQLNTLLEDAGLTGVLDIGGSAAGARVLARYRPRLLTQSFTLLLVLNASRPATATAEGALRSLEEIQSIVGLPVNGLVSNTHLCGETTQDTVLQGARLAEEVSRIAGIPLVCHMAEASLLPLPVSLTAPVFSVKRYMKHPWES